MANWWEDAPIIDAPTATGGDEWWAEAPLVEGGTSDGGFMPYLNQGIANAIGMPVDAINWGLGAIGLPVSEQPIGGSASIRQGMEALGVDTGPNRAPQGLVENVGAGIGGAAGSLLPGAGLVGGIARSASPIARGAAETISRPFAASPARSLAAETAAGAGSGIGMDVAEQVAPGAPFAQMTGAFIGGGLAGAGPSLSIAGARKMPGVQLAESLVMGEVLPFTESGAMSRARGRVGGLVEDAELARYNLENPTIGGLSPAVSTGDRRLMALEQSVRDANPAIDRSMRDSETASMDALRAALVEPGGGVDPSIARAALAERISGTSAKIQQQLDRAQRAAQQRISALSPERRASESSMIVREELENAYKAARADERAAWDAVPQEAVVPVQNARAAYDNIVAGLGRAQLDDVPTKARQFLEIGGNQSFRGSETVREMHALYSSMRESARIARAAGEPNKARISDLIADAIMEDLASAPDAGAALNSAVNASRELNRVFSRGDVGRIRGAERSGGLSTPPEVTLDATVGRGGTRGAVAMDSIMEAAPATAQAMPDYLRSMLSNAAMRGDQFSPNAARNFVNRNIDLMERSPDLRRQIEDAITGVSTAERAGDRARQRMAGLSQGAAATFTGANPGAEIQAILRSRNPREMAAQAMRQVRRDPEAVSGVKSALVNDLMAGARTSTFDDTGAPYLSGRALKRRLADERYSGVAGEILSKEEMGRLRTVADEISRIETMQGRLPETGPVMGDQPNSIVSYFARVLAARSGAAMGQGTSGASLQTASMASNRMKRILTGLTNDRAEKLIVQAVSGDKELFDALLQPVSQLTRKQERRLIEALGGSAGSYAASRDDDGDPLFHGIVEGITGGLAPVMPNGAQ